MINVRTPVINEHCGLDAVKNFTKMTIFEFRMARFKAHGSGTPARRKLKQVKLLPF